MRNLTIYLALTVCLFAGKLSAQETFETKARIIADKIEKITKDEKENLKMEIEEVNKQFDNGTITKVQADDEKKKLAQARVLIIENKIAVVQEELTKLVQQKVEGKLKASDSLKTHGKYLTVSLGNSVKEKKHIDNIEKRTTSQLVIAIGVNNLVTDNSIADSDFKYMGSSFFEWGLTLNSRLMKNDNLLHLKYGMSLMYNNLRPTDNRVFVTDGNQTNLETSSIDLKDSRFRNVYLTAPVHLEFDFTKSKNNDDKKSFKTHESVRLGIGGYAGFRIKSKQKTCYEIDGNNFTTKEKGDFNANDFIYGLSTYIGYKETSLYLKYDLNPLFKDNAVKQNNISLGVRFDLN
jgi:hypothetical protein